MTIPNTARDDMLSGLKGELSHDGPVRCRPGILDSATESNNEFGRAFTVKDEGDNTVEAGGTGAFAGILVNPKAHAVENVYQANGTAGELVQMGEVFVELDETTTAAAVGGKVYFVPASGQLATDPDTAANTEIIGARINRHEPSAASSNMVLAIVSLTGPQPA